jgi:hypothetical protein
MKPTIEKVKDKYTGEYYALKNPEKKDALCR